MQHATYEKDLETSTSIKLHSKVENLLFFCVFADADIVISEILV